MRETGGSDPYAEQFARTRSPAEYVVLSPDISGPFGRDITST